MKKLILLLLPLFVFQITLNAQKTAFTSQDALNVKSFGIADLTDDGQFIAGFERSRKDRLNIDHKRFGDGNYVAPYTRKLVIINSENGKKVYPFETPEIYGAAKWSPDGAVLAFIKYEDSNFNLYLYDIKKKKLKKAKFNAEYAIANGSVLEWNPVDEKVILAVRSEAWSFKADSMFKEATHGPITVYDSEQPHLKWDAIRAHNNLRILIELDLETGITKKLTEEGIFNAVRMTKDGKQLIFNQSYPLKTVYDRKGGTAYELAKIVLADPKKITLEERSKKRKNYVWNSKNNVYAYADSGKIFVRNIDEKKAVKVSSDTSEIIKSDTSKVEFNLMRWSPNDHQVLASSKKGYWLINIKDNQMEMVYTFPEDKEKAPRLNIFEWSPDAKFWYMTYSAKDKWERGLMKYDIENRNSVDLVKNSNLYTRWRMSKDNQKFFYNFSDGNEPNELYGTNIDFSNPKPLTDLNTWIKNKKITKSELIKYRDSDGNELNGILYYPVDYKEGKKYPLVCEIYETFFNNGYSYSMNLVTNAGFFGFKPSVNLEKGYPGEAWIKGITSGINKLIERGLIDEDKVGVHGTSYGGYATSLLISQTDRFAAAINISGKVNIISFLGDSPRIGTRNYSAAEVGQDRIGETLWEAPMKYFATSAVLYADRINTPHLLLTGEGDWNVPAVNSRELYYALRRLGKEVMWVNYYNGGHGAGASSNESDFHDHWRRIIDWYSTHFEKETKN